MDTTKYIELAKSKDTTRFNLQHVYRDVNHIVATDGHRMHFANSLPDANPHFIDGYDGAFPEWKQIIPKQVPTGKIEYCHIGQNATRVLKVLKQILSLAKDNDRGCCVELHLDDEKPVTIKLKAASLNVTLEHVTPFTYTGEPVVIGVNLSYFNDAISFLKDHSFTIDIHGELGPMQVHAMGESIKAILMPMRLK